MKKRVVITGMGVICPAGTNKSMSWNNVLSGKSFVQKLDSNLYKNIPSKIAATLDGLDLHETIPKSKVRTMAPSTRLALLATHEAVEDSKIFLSPVNKEAIGVSVGVGMIDLEDVCQTAKALESSYSKVSPYFVPRILLNMAAGQISMAYGIQGPNHAVSTACATGAHAIGDGFRFIQYGQAKAMICGAAESCISPLSMASFCKLRALSTQNEMPELASRPFDMKRDGFVMGEGSAMLILEELEHALNRNARIYGEILGYGLSGDAAHLTAPSENGQGAFLAMNRAIMDANINKTQITYINAHATSTPVGDAIELIAIKRLFEKHCINIHVSSTKGAHGHLLGSAGNLESIFTILASYEGIIPPTANLNNICKEAENLICVSKSPMEWKQKKRIAIKNAFGFGGTNASLCFSNYV
ncbi:Thiolase-like,3-oxoacyl-[acyl-carrier-protein] synthase 2,Beta-ketoacyl synthase, active site,Beta- [Cinara cedri]|uniref:3-oxoacyl-[acyl-carrier-protein] synthase n=1 Tax=Cinara cedri TaxID=506608 RepID=A0A5E4N0U9_9HEMI|nr:Thiolase-like,3-oxoacyl-[acyl-carrier-protein] synthase 2,Beta-ketoacyl synthase, active site,Beta- [Cinara cedri]